jgi:tetratricopeptide (TPR) repeat protein
MVETRESLRLLIERGMFQEAKRTLELALEAARTQASQRQVLELLELVPTKVQLSSSAWIGLSCRMYCVADNRSGLRALLEQVKVEERSALLYRAWDALRAEEFGEAIAWLEGSRLSLRRFELGLSWRIRAVAAFSLEEPGERWRDAFARAKAILTGISLGRCLLEVGVCEERSGDHTAARHAWAQALALLEHDAHYAAILHYNIGLSLLRERLPDAENHFLEMERLSKRRDAHGFRGRALCGLAASRRALGEYDRAAYTYAQALRHAGDDDDRRQALSGWGQTLRLAGQPTAALTKLSAAATATLEDQRVGQSWVFVTIAAIHAQQGALEAARSALGRSGSLESRDIDLRRAQIVRAEMARQSGDFTLARQLLTASQLNALMKDEECRCFPELFALLEVVPPQAQRPVTTVSVELRGSLRVQVNGREIALKPTGRPAELLALLIYHGGRLSGARVLEALYQLSADSRERRRCSQALWAVMRELGHALGWASSVRNVDGVYTLDPLAVWQTLPADPHTFRSAGDRFLDGIDSQWALEIDERWHE